MYPKEYFVDRFKEDETDYLVEKLATSDLAESAREAILEILAKRGVDKSKLLSQMKE